MMQPISYLGLAVLLGLPGCRDFSAPSFEIPTEAVMVEPSRSTEAELHGPPSTEGTLCTSYRDRLSEYRTALARKGDDADLEGKVATFEDLVASACDQIEPLD
jgi:hypothetical protein